MRELFTWKRVLVVYNCIKQEGKTMRITVDIDADSIAKVKDLTGEKKHATAIRAAVTHYINEIERKRFLMRVMDGKGDYGRTNDELEALGDYDTD
ncbi:MAG: hypothetical protein ACI9OU_001787 [Candidatus Promineifilaceae bacterium]|jgi:hypothetical protein